jgi:hypothetical protein
MEIEKEIDKVARALRNIDRKLKKSRTKLYKESDTYTKLLKERAGWEIFRRDLRKNLKKIN